MLIPKKHLAATFASASISRELKLLHAICFEGKEGTYQAGNLEQVNFTVLNLHFIIRSVEVTVFVSQRCVRLQ